MSNGLRIGVVGGAGWLGGAIADAILEADIVRHENLSLSFRSKNPRRLPQCHWTLDNQALADRSDIIVLSVRPGDWPGLQIDATGKLVISVMAGIRLDALCSHHRTGKAVRALPNAAAEVRKSYTPWIATDEVDDADRAVVRAVFDACGFQDQVFTEAEIDYLTGLTGSGPAFPALLAEAMMLDAIRHGMTPQIARRAVNTLFVGAGRMLEREDTCPADTVRTFLGYQGTTAAAIEEMRGAGFGETISRGLAAALRESVSMGEIP